MHKEISKYFCHSSKTAYIQHTKWLISQISNIDNPEAVADELFECV